MGWLVLLGMAALWPPLLGWIVYRMTRTPDTVPLGDRPWLTGLAAFAYASLVMLLIEHWRTGG